MFSLSEVYFAELHTLAQVDLQTLIASFATAFPFIVDVLVKEDDYERMLADASEISGDEHPETIREYESTTHTWAQFHPKISHMVMRGGMMLSTRVGFKNAQEAIQFKLKWFQS